MPFNVRLATKDDPRPVRRQERRTSALAEGVANFIQGALFAFGVMFMLAIAFWVLSLSGVLGDPLVLASWMKLG